MEQVLVFEEGMMEGFTGFVDHSISTTISDWDYFVHKILPYASFVDRAVAEVNPAIKQIIPYQVLRSNGKVLAYKRTHNSGEKRLHEKWSVGIGGHINTEDSINATFAYEIVANSVDRELREELEIPFDATFLPNPYGLIYDPSNEVGKVHFGVVIAIDSDSWQEIKVKENALTNIAWYTIEDALALPNLENWSKIVLESMKR
jgi:predicted NUDIX family phosphoesterase